MHRNTLISWKRWVWTFLHQEQRGRQLTLTLHAKQTNFWQCTQNLSNTSSLPITHNLLHLLNQQHRSSSSLHFNCKRSKKSLTRLILTMSASSPSWQVSSILPNIPTNTNLFHRYRLLIESIYAYWCITLPLCFHVNKCRIVALCKQQQLFQLRYLFKPLHLQVCNPCLQAYKKKYVDESESGVYLQWFKFFF